MSTLSIAFGGTIPQHYDEYLGDFLFEPYALDMLARIDKPAVTSVLELACGTGRVTQHLLAQLPEATITATDLNPAMLAVARELIPSPRVKWDTVDMSTLPYADEQFDVVFCQFGVMFVPDKLKALREMHRVLTKGGKLIFNTWGPLADNRAWAIANEVVSSFFSDQPVALFAAPFSLTDEAAVLHWLEQAGFQHRSATSVPKTGRATSAAIAAKGFVLGLPIYTSIQERNPAMMPKILAALEQELAVQLGSEPLESPLQAWVFEANK